MGGRSFMSILASFLASLRRLLQPHPAARPIGPWRTLFTLVALVLSTVFLVKAVPVMARWWTHYPWDGFIDWGGAREMLAGRDPYSEASLKAIGLTKEYGLGHPPTALIWFYPLAHFDALTMKHVFTIITLLMLLYHVGLVVRELGYPQWSVVALLVFSAVYQTDWFILHLDQVDLSELIAFLYVLCWVFLRRGNDAAAGIMAGLACTLKLYPGLLVVFLLLARRWRAVLGAGLAYLAFAAEAVRRLGPSCFRHFFEQTGSYATLWVANVRNASIDGIVHRWFYPLWRSFPEGRPSKTSASLLAAVISVAMLAGAWFLSRRSVRDARRLPTAIDRPFALFSLLTMAPGPYQWEHYNVTLILPFLLLLADSLWGAWPSGRLVRVLTLGLVLPATAAMLNVNYWWRIDLAGRARVWSWKLAFYEYSAWLPWFLLAVALGARLYVLNRDRARALATDPHPLAT